MPSITGILFSIVMFARLLKAAEPSPVADLVLELGAPHTVRLEWSEVEHDLAGRSLLGRSYRVFGSSQPWFQPGPSNLLAVTQEPLAVVETGDSLQFFQVVVAAVERPDLVAVTPGSFIMGQSNMAPPEHPVTLTHAFELGLGEVSNLQYLEAAQWALDHGWATLSGGNLHAQGSLLLAMTNTNCEITVVEGRLALRQSTSADDHGFAVPYDPARHPVQSLTWFGAASYCDWLSLLEGLPAYYQGGWEQIPAPNNPYTASGYRLPAEAEWEWASGHDENHLYPWGNATPSCELASFLSQGVTCVGWTRPVADWPAGASPWGIQDLADNVREWCNDRYIVYPDMPLVDPVGPPTGNFRIARGGSWYTPSPDLQCAARTVLAPGTQNYLVGMRICRTLD